MITFSAIIPSGGSGSRSGRDRPKQYELLLGREILLHAARPFLDHPFCMELIIAVDPAWKEAVSALFDSESKSIGVVDGGVRRQDSVKKGLDLVAEEGDVVLVHDAARPCLQKSTIDRVLSGMHRAECVVPGLAVTDTLKQVGPDGYVRQTVRREEFVTVQTPQGFRKEALVNAYRQGSRNGWQVTDEAGLIEKAGGRVLIVDGDRDNIKVTLPGDFARAERLLRRV